MHHFRITEREPVPVRYTRKIARAPLYGVTSPYPGRIASAGNSSGKRTL